MHAFVSNLLQTGMHDVVDFLYPKSQEIFQLHKKHQKKLELFRFKTFSISLKILYYKNKITKKFKILIRNFSVDVRANVNTLGPKIIHLKNEKFFSRVKYF
jgi:hypothetical protein